MKKIFLLLAFLQCSCASKFFIPGNRFMIPESSGGLFNWEFKGGGAGVTQVQIADDISLAVPNTTPELAKNSSTALGFQLGLAKILDVYYNNVSGAPGMAGIKIQLIGDSFISAKANNFSLSLASGAGFGNVSTTVSTSATDNKSDTKFSGYEALALIGYRLSDGILLYTNPFMTKILADTKIERTTTATGVTATIAEPNGTGTMNGVTLGARFGKHFHFSAEVSMTETEWTRSNPTELKSEKFADTALGIAIGGAW